MGAEDSGIPRPFQPRNPVLNLEKPGQHWGKGKRMNSVASKRTNDLWRMYRMTRGPRWPRQGVGFKLYLGCAKLKILPPAFSAFDVTSPTLRRWGVLCKAVAADRWCTDHCLIWEWVYPSIPSPSSAIASPQARLNHQTQLR